MAGRNIILKGRLRAPFKSTIRVFSTGFSFSRLVNSTRAWRFFAALLVFLSLPGFQRSMEARQDAHQILLQSGLDTSLPEGAEPMGGDWQVREGHLEQARYGGPFLLLMGQPDWNDYTARVRVRFPAPSKGTEAGLALHVRDAGHYVVFSLKNKKGGLYAVLRIENSAGLTHWVNAPYLPTVKQTTMVGDQKRLLVDPEIGHELRVEVHGTAFYGYVDGRHVVDYDFSSEVPSWYPHERFWPHQSPTHGRVGLFSAGWPASFQNIEVRRLTDFSHIHTPQSGRRDAAGRLLPRQSYSETMRRFTEWVLNCDQVVEKEVAPPSLRHLEPYVLSIWLSADDELLNFDVGEFAFNSGMFISGAVQYYLYSGDTRILEKARRLADWGIANSTPADWAMPYLAPSIVKWLPDGGWRQIRTYDEWGLEPDKSAYLGDAYLRLYAATGKRKYLEAARRIAGTLLKLRQPDGHWPFRINPQTGKINHLYTHSQLWYIHFFERLARMTGEQSWLQLRDGALRWMLENPVKTKNWQGLYGDFASGAKSYDQWVPLEFAQYLVDHRGEHPEYLDVARGIVDWVYKTLVVSPGLHPGVPGLIEQSSYPIVIAHHELRLAETHAVLWGATQDPKQKQVAIDIANSVTWLLMSDGKMRMANHGPHAGYSYMRGVPFLNGQFTRIMAEIPETAPRDENHFLQTSTDVRQIQYGARSIRYETVGPGFEIFIVAQEPQGVEVDAVKLPRQGAASRLKGWHYDPTTQLLRISHEGTKVKILM